MKNDVLNAIAPYLPRTVTDSLANSTETSEKLCEVRITVEKPVMADFMGKPVFLRDCTNGRRLIADLNDLKTVTDSVTHGSLYSVNETIKKGFVTIPGGHRIGFCGTAVADASQVRHIKDISSVCLRISRSVKNCAADIKDELCAKGCVYNVLIASPPGCGKTTVLRETCRMLADGLLSCGIQKVGIADERSEIAAVYRSVPQLDVGCAAFVCDGYKKSDAMQMMLRAMSPSVIATDEIGSAEDFEAVKAALKSGVSVIATAHANTLEDLLHKYGAENIHICFEKIIFLKGKGRTDKIYRRENNDY